MTILPDWPVSPAPADLAAGWRERYSGRDLFRVAAGRDWIRLHLAGEDRRSLFLIALPGANLAFSHAGPLPPALQNVLTAQKDHPLTRLLAGACLVTAGALPGDRVIGLRFEADARSYILLHQLFGSPGNTVVLDQDGILHWARRRPPHRLLSEVPPAAAWHEGAAVAEPASVLVLETLSRVLAIRLSDRIRAALTRRARTAERLHENLSRDLETAAQGDRFRRTAEALAARLHEVTAGDDACRTVDPRDGCELTIELDPALTPAANLEAWFRRARKAERGREIIAERRQGAGGEAAALRDHLAWLDDAVQRHALAPSALEHLAELQDWAASHADLLPTAGRAGRRTTEQQDPVRPFRRYLIDDQWEVWVGRNNGENDELTHRASHGRDIWLHAQGVPGSHVILRTNGHPERVPAMVLEKAAGLAALHSRARNSGLVPVVHTERRYVRKPRKAAPGTAVCLRDRSLFAEPGLAPGVRTA